MWKFCWPHCGSFHLLITRGPFQQCLLARLSWFGHFLPSSPTLYNRPALHYQADSLLSEPPRKPQMNKSCLDCICYCRSVVSDSVTPWTAALQASLSFTISRSLLKFRSIESAIPSNHLILCHPLLLLPSIFPSIRVFSNELALRIRWPMYWSFNFSISPSNKHSGLISFWTDWFDLTIQSTLKSLLQHHSSEASILCAQPSLWSNSHIYVWLLKKP